MTKDLNVCKVDGILKAERHGSIQKTLQWCHLLMLYLAATRQGACFL